MPDPLDPAWKDIRSLLAAPAAMPERAPVNVGSEPSRPPQLEIPEPIALPERPKRRTLGTHIDTYGPWLSLFAAIGLTASGEYALAVLAGWPASIAWLLPAAIDIYVTVALRRHRDLIPALGLMVVANAAFHLASQRLFGTTPTGRPLWWLVVGVAAIAPYVMWRVHELTGTETRAAATPSVAPLQRRPDATPETAAAAPTAKAHEAVSAPVAESAAATPETAADVRETVSVKRAPKPKGRGTATGAAKRKDAPQQLLPKDEQLKIVAKIVAAHQGDNDPPLNDIATALGASKATASRRLAEYTKQQSA